MLALKMPNSAVLRRSGFTLIELMVTLAIVAILASLAAPQFQRTIANSNLKSTANSFNAAILQARSEAIKNNRSTYVQNTSGTDFSQGWIVFVDNNANSTFESGTDTLVLSSGPLAGGVASIGALTNKTAFRFDSNGYLRTISAAAGTPNGSVGFGLSPNPWGDNVRCIVVALSGRARIVSQATTVSSCPTT